MKKDKRKFRAFAIMLNDEESQILRRLRCDYGINISRTIKIIMKEKLEQLDKEKGK
jgi:post-segregation antitoxin (ccd killing protein)